MKKEESTKELVKTLALAVVFALSIRSCLYEPFHIPSSSMKPGLLIGDYIFVSKLSYGYSKYSFPLSSLNPLSGRLFADDPKRGDTAVFRLPRDPDINYIKRIVGTPGDVVRVENGQLFINNEAIQKIRKGEFKDENGVHIPMFKETIDEKDFYVLDQYPELPQDDTGNFQVPKDHYFVMGDNRDNSQDSRYQTKVGFIPKENLVGRATMIFFSSSDSFWKFWNWHKSIRFSRVFKKIS